MEQTLTARQASVKALTFFDENNSINPDLLNGLEGQDRQQANEYVQGILRRKSYLDFLISKFSSVPVEEMNITFKNVLRVGIYDLLFMDGTPDYAAINEAVELAKKLSGSRGGDLMNAILRRVQRELSELPKPDFSDRTKLIATTFSHPEWLVKRWVSRFGEREAFQLMQYNNQRPSYYLRTNGLKTNDQNFKLRLTKAGVDFEESDWLPSYYKVQTINKVRQKGWFQKGFCQVQDIAAGFAPTILDPQPGEDIYDLCAAPGTKTIAMCDMMENKGSITAVDISGERIGNIAENVTNYGAEIVKIQRADVIEERFKLVDGVLLDAPCSGTGVMAKRADLRWRRQEADLESFAHQQDELLDAAANMVKRGGRLVYATCSIEPEENMERIEKFLETYNNFELENLEDYLPEEVLAYDGTAYQTLPHIHQCDGHFGVLLRRKI
ncbi:16S rRNA (cytosine(967)-C(5))-methyltransferase RsmB [Balneolaceae bacterium ANBcel3]|nr:16S rRNA (cytosine(967)-C(5))-methyltransferase RsmB [Balneolaceae bacterium ANBcel3]